MNCTAYHGKESLCTIFATQGSATAFYPIFGSTLYRSHPYCGMTSKKLQLYALSVQNMAVMVIFRIEFTDKSKPQLILHSTTGIAQFCTVSQMLLSRLCWEKLFKDTIQSRAIRASRHRSRYYNFLKCYTYTHTKKAKPYGLIT